MENFHVGDRVSNRRIIAEEQKVYGVVTEVLKNGKVVVVWNHDGCRRILVPRQRITVEEPKSLIVESGTCVAESRREPDAVWYERATDFYSKEYETLQEARSRHTPGDFDERIYRVERYEVRSNEPEKMELY